jgi:cardiolipin synthase A/B
VIRPFLAALSFALLAAACSPGEEEADVCELAARHRQECLGDYVTPPACDEAAQGSARRLLETTCAAMAGLQDPGKADGAFCDWFGAGCTADEPFFQGPRCARDADCASGRSCVEQHCFAGVASDEMAGILDEFTHSVETSGDQTHLLVANSETRALRNRMMRGAQRSIYFSALVLRDDEVARETIGILEDAARRGLDVRVIVDAFTQYGWGSYDDLEALAAAGVRVLPFNPVLEWAGLRLRWSVALNSNQRLHEKILIVDGKEAVVGGRNVGEEYLVDGRWRDTDVHVVGPGVAEIQRMYMHIWELIADWERQAGCPQGFDCPEAGDLGDDPPTVARAGDAATRPIYSDPRRERTPDGYRAMLALVRGARRSITIANSYFVPPRRLRKHLKAAAARGVKVTILTNSLGSTDAWWMYYASLNYYEELIGAGIEVRQYRGDETMHAKTLLVDDEVAMIGSYNLDPRSAASNSESMLIIRGGPTPAELRRAFDVDLAFADRVNADVSWSDWLKARAFRLVEPLL